MLQNSEYFVLCHSACPKRFMPGVVTRNLLPVNFVFSGMRFLFSSRQKSVVISLGMTAKHKYSAQTTLTIYQLYKALNSSLNVE